MEQLEDVIKTTTVFAFFAGQKGIHTTWIYANFRNIQISSSLERKTNGSWTTSLSFDVAEVNSEFE